MDLLLHLRSFVAVAEALNFSHAADELGIAQPLLSRRIKALEKHLGDELFDRGRRQIRITDLGVILLPHAKDLLARSDHVIDVVRAARSATAVTLSVPPDCDPRALARIIRGGAERGLVLRIRELPAAQRMAADGPALIPVALTEATIRVRLGLASAEPLAGPVHLDSLRHRRNAPRAGPDILVTAEDDVPVTAAALRRSAARAGLDDRRLVPAASSAAALADVLAGNSVLLCSASFARRHGVEWTPLADATLGRGYDLTGAPAEHRDWLRPLLVAAVGGSADRAAEVAPERDDRRLAASG